MYINGDVVFTMISKMTLPGICIYLRPVKFDDIIHNIQLIDGILSVIGSIISFCQMP